MKGKHPILPADKLTGPVAWMVHNRVTPNILMFVFLVGGLFMATRIKQEVFPEFELDVVTVRVPYPGSSPEEVEQGIVLAIEEAVRGIEGVKEILGTAAEGSGAVRVELQEGANGQKAYQEIQQQVDRIITFPEEAEKPRVTLVARRREVLNVQIYGEADEWSLRELAEHVRDRLLQDPRITQVELEGARPFEVHIEVSAENLRAYGLTLEEIARKIDATSVEVPGGGLKTEGGEVLLRFNERRNWAREFAEIPIVTTPEGVVLYLEDIARVIDGFEDSDQVASYNGRRAIGVAIYRVGEQTPIGISDAVHEAMEEIAADLPPGVDYAINRDRSKIYRQRLELLLKNAFLGLLLVLVVLGLFLEFKLAFWVTMGIPISFLGGILFLPGMDVTINMISMFAFILALGIVVDDAIVAGENIYEYRQKGMNPVEAAIRGARDVMLPISFSIITNIIAFMPLLFVPGTMGKIWGVIPLVVMVVFVISWVEALFILPVHLAHPGAHRNPVSAFLHRQQQRFSRFFQKLVTRYYGPFLDFCIRNRYLTVCTGIAILLIVFGYVLSGRMGLILMPKVESDRAVVTARLPYGSAFSKVAGVRDRLVAEADAVAGENGGTGLVEGIYAEIEENNIEVTVYLTDPDVRPISTAAFTHLWREKVGALPGLQSLRFESDRGGPGRGPSITMELSHRDIEVLDRASTDLANTLIEFADVKDIDDGYDPGKQQLDFQLKPEGRGLGLTSQAVARQMRAAFYGAEALRQQRGRNEVKVKVRLPEDRRLSEYEIEQMLIRTPSGRDVPLMQIAEVTRARAYTSITRRDGRRTVNVTANVEPIDRTQQVLDTLKAEYLPRLVADYPGLSYRFEGRQADLKDALNSLVYGLALAMIIIFVLLAVPFRSYVQPAIVMMAIPFGIVGAVLGHLIMGYSMSIISLQGIVALSGVVVNGSLIMIDYANRRRREGHSAFEAIHMAGLRRFRPILLTTLTTFGGLTPMIFETSRQARFMIPMAISLGYGILFATVITLLLVPCLYLVIEDLVNVFKSAFSTSETPAPAVSAE